MKRCISMFVLALSLTACAPADSDSLSDETTQTGDKVEETSAALTASPISPVTLDPASGVLVPGSGFDTGDGSSDLMGKNKCTPDRQMTCDMCVDGCDYLCDRPNGGGPNGGCIGLFCPTRCDACVLGCYKACGKCIPSQF
jgi:hypothetical protein